MNKPISRLLWISVVVIAATRIATAQLTPAIGYMFPTGGQAGQTIDVTLGGYDWTPDMQVFVHDPRIKLKIVDTPGPVIVPEPPYWFGKKARRGPFPLPRETRARACRAPALPPECRRSQSARTSWRSSARQSRHSRAATANARLAHHLEFDVRVYELQDLGEPDRQTATQEIS